MRPVAFKERAKRNERETLRRVTALWACFVTSFLLAIALPALAQTGSAQPPLPALRELTDEVGRKVQVPQDLTRVVSLAPNLTEIVFALGDGDRLVGDTDYCDYPPEAARKPHVGGVINPNLEQIAALTPNLVLATKSINRLETVNALDRIGLPVYVTDPHSVEDVIGSVERLGVALGEEKSAAKLADELRARLAELQRRLAGSEARSVLFVEWTDPLISAGRDTFVADAVRLAGGRSVVDTAADWPHLSLEEIVRLQPDTVVFAGPNAEETHREIETLRSRPGWRDLEAVRHDNIVILSDAINRPAPRMVDAIEQLARALHPEAFSSHANSSRNHETGVEQEACACVR